MVSTDCDIEFIGQISFYRHSDGTVSTITGGFTDITRLEALKIITNINHHAYDLSSSILKEFERDKP